MSWGQVAEAGLSVAGGLIGGVVGNSIETGVDGYKTYQDIRSHQYGDAALDGALTIIHGGEAVADGMAGEWW